MASCYAHLSKRLSDLKQNGTQKRTPVSGTVFNTLSHGVVSFVASGSSKNHPQTLERLFEGSFLSSVHNIPRDFCDVLLHIIHGVYVSFQSHDLVSHREYDIIFRPFLQQEPPKRWEFFHAGNQAKVHKGLHFVDQTVDK